MKLQEDLKEAIIEWRRNGNVKDPERIQAVLQTAAWQKLQSLISQCVPMKALELCCENQEKYRISTEVVTPQYWINLAYIADTETETEA